MKQPPSGRSLKSLVIGPARSLGESNLFHKVSLIALFAWVGLGADGLSSSCYGPEETFRALGSYDPPEPVRRAGLRGDHRRDLRQLFADHFAVPLGRRRLPGGEQAARPVRSGWFRAARC